jgi:hypothetical protein
MVALDGLDYNGGPTINKSQMFLHLSSILLKKNNAWQQAGPMTKINI